MPISSATDISDHYNDVIMTMIASQITSPTVVYSAVYSDADQRKHESSASLVFVWGIHRDQWIPRTKGQLRGECFHLMTSSCKQNEFPGSTIDTITKQNFNGSNKDGSLPFHYSDVIMSAMASQITAVSIVCTTVCTGTDQWKHRSSASPAFVRGIHRWPVNSTHKGQLRGKCFNLMMSSCANSIEPSVREYLLSWSDRWLSHISTL